MRVASRRLRNGLIGCVCGLSLIGSVFLMRLLIERILLGQGIPFSSSTSQTLPQALKALALEEVPEPVRRLNRRNPYPERHDFWAWQAPWFQNIAISSFPSTEYKNSDLISPPLTFQEDVARKELGGNQFLLHLGPTQNLWWVGAEPGRLHFTPLTKGNPLTFDIGDVGPDLMSVTTAHFNQTENERILVGSPQSNKFWVFKADGESITQTQEINFSATGKAGVRFIQIANIEGRRQSDLLVATELWLLLFPIQGGAVINNPTLVASFYGIESLLTHDFTGDGQDEILIADWDSVMSLFEIDDGVLVERDHWEFPVKLLPNGRRCPTYAKIADLYGDKQKELIVYEGYAEGRLTQKIHLFSWDADEEELVRHTIDSPAFSGWDSQKGSETHLVELFPWTPHQNDKEKLLLVRWFKEAGLKNWRFDFVRYQEDRGWVLEGALHLPDQASPFRGTIQIGDQQIILGKNKAVAF